MRTGMLRWQRAPEVEWRSSTGLGTLARMAAGDGSGRAVESQGAQKGGNLQCKGAVTGEVAQVRYGATEEQGG